MRTRLKSKFASSEVCARCWSGGGSADPDVLVAVKRSAAALCEGGRRALAAPSCDPDCGDALLTDCWRRAAGFAFNARMADLVGPLWRHGWTTPAVLHQPGLP